MRIERILLFAMALLLVTLPLSATVVAADGQSGTWKMNPAKSKYNPGPTPKSLTVRVDADENSVKVNADGTNADGTPSHVEYSAKFDGKDYSIIGTYADTVSVKRIDANTMQAVLKKKDGQLMMTVITTVSTDGKTRTSNFKGKDGQGREVINYVVYDKQ